MAAAAVFSDFDPGEVLEGLVKRIEAWAKVVGVGSKDAVVGVVVAPILHVVFDVEVGWDPGLWRRKLNAFLKVWQNPVPTPCVVGGS